MDLDPQAQALFTLDAKAGVFRFHKGFKSTIAPLEMDHPGPVLFIPGRGNVPPAFSHIRVNGSDGIAELIIGNHISPVFTNNSSGLSRNFIPYPMANKI